MTFSKPAPLSASVHCVNIKNIIEFIWYALIAAFLTYGEVTFHWLHWSEIDVIMYWMPWIVMSFRANCDSAADREIPCVRCPVDGTDGWNETSVKWDDVGGSQQSVLEINETTWTVLWAAVISYWLLILINYWLLIWCVDCSVSHIWSLLHDCVQGHLNTPCLGKNKQNCFCRKRKCRRKFILCCLLSV